MALSTCVLAVWGFLRVGCVERYTAIEGCVCVLCLKTADLTCSSGLNAALDEWHSETWIRRADGYGY